MSGYTIGEIVVWLLLTAVLAFALGWMTRELLLRRRTGATADTSVVVPAVEPDPEEEPEPAPEPEPVVTPGPHPGSALPLPGGAAPSAAHVVKVSRGSKIYHAPSSPAYARTTAALWFTDARAAEDAGFRKPKNG
nr:hypothetical protein [Aeromicrobium sp.]